MLVLMSNSQNVSACSFGKGKNRIEVEQKEMG